MNKPKTKPAYSLLSKIRRKWIEFIVTEGEAMTLSHDWAGGQCRKQELVTWTN